MTRVLVVDDDPFFRTYARACLEQLGHDVLDAEDGNAGLAQCAKSRPDLILADLYMPNKGGLEFIRELRLDQAKAKIIAMSIGYTNDDGKCLDLALDAGAHAAICKPFSIDQLRRAIQVVLRIPEDSSPDVIIAP